MVTLVIVHISILNCIPESILWKKYGIRDINQSVLFWKWFLHRQLIATQLATSVLWLMIQFPNISVVYLNADVYKVSLLSVSTTKAAERQKMYSVLPPICQARFHLPSALPLMVWKGRWAEVDFQAWASSAGT